MNEPNRQTREAMHGAEYVQQFTNGRQIARVARLVRHITLPHDANVLDVGCGTGLLANLLASRYGAYTGVDFSQEMVQEARKHADENSLRHCRFLRGDAIDVMHAGAGTWDAIFMLDISEHVPDPEWSAIVQAAWQALKPGGKVYLHTPNLDFILERLKQHGLMRQFPEHVAVRNARGNMRFFHDTGYASVTCETLPHYNALRWLHPMTHLPMLGKYLVARLWIVAVK